MAEGSRIAEEGENEESFDEHETYLVQRHVFDLNFSYSDSINLITSVPKRINISQNGDRFDQNGSNPSDNSLSVKEPQDADYSRTSSLSYELENLIFARFPRSENWKLCFVSKRCLSLVKSGELYRIRKDIGVKEPSIFMFATGEYSWWAFDKEFKSRRKLPILPSDHCFASGDKTCLSPAKRLTV